MPIKRTNRPITLENASLNADSAARANERSRVVTAGVDATRAASRSAHGVSASEELRSVETRVALFRRSSSVDLAQTVDSSALEVKAILGRMRRLAVRGASHPMSEQDRSILQDEFAMLAAEIDRVAMAAETAQRSRAGEAVDPRLDASDVEALPSGHLVDEFIGRLTSRSLGVSVEQAGLDSPEESEWALFRIDTAENKVLAIRDEFGTVEERMDKALEALNEFVDKHFPDAERHGPPSEVMRAAERVRLELMHQDAVSKIGQADGLQKSVSALLQ